MKFHECSFRESLSMILVDGRTEGHDGPSGPFLCLNASKEGP